MSLRQALIPEELFGRVQRRLDTLDRHAADLMFLQVSAQEVVLGQRRRFSLRSKSLIIQAVAAEPYLGRCPCCTSARVLTEEGRVIEGAERHPQTPWRLHAGLRPHARAERFPRRRTGLVHAQHL